MENINIMHGVIYKTNTREKQKYVIPVRDNVYKEVKLIVG